MEDDRSIGRVTAARIGSVNGLALACVGDVFNTQETTPQKLIERTRANFKTLPTVCNRMGRNNGRRPAGC